MRFRPDGAVVIEDRIPTGDVSRLPAETRVKLGATPTPTPGGATPR